jgi:hypothetical protein
MPNWCMNNLTIEHDDVEKATAFADAYRRGEACEYCLPVPCDDEDEAYNWRVANWGTKWDIGEGEFIQQDGNKVYCSFDSAWAPPLGLYERLNQLGFMVHATYFEPGCCFCGTWTEGIEDFWEGDPKAFPKELVHEYNMNDWFDEDEDDALFRLVARPSHPEASKEVD